MLVECPYCNKKRKNMILKVEADLLRTILTYKCGECGNKFYSDVNGIILKAEQKTIF